MRSDAGRQGLLHERLTDVFLVLLLTVYLFVFNSDGYLSLTQAKRPLFYVLCGGYAVLCLLLYFEQLVVGERKPTGLRQLASSTTWTQRLVLLYWLLTVLSALLSDARSVTWFGGTRDEGVLTISIYCAVFLAASIFGRAKPWHLYVLGGAVLLQSLLCAVQLQGGNPLGLYPDGVNYFDANAAYSGAYLGTVGNVDFLGTFYCLAAALLLAALLRMDSRRRWLMLLPLAAAGYVIFRMRVWSCIVGLTVGMLLALPLVLRLSDGARRKLALATFGCAVLAGAAAVVFAVCRGVPRSLESGRLYIWREVLERVPQHIWFGAGPDTMSLANIPPFERYDAALGQTRVAHIDAAHNEYLNVLYHQGIFALLAELGAIAASLLSWWKHSRRCPAAAILGAGVLCYAIQAFFNISMFLTAPFFWLALGLLDGSCRGNHIQKGRKQHERKDLG